ASSESEEAARHMDKIIVLIIFSCDGEPTIPQVHYYHDNNTICARFCYSSGERFRSSCPVPFIIDDSRFQTFAKRKSRDGPRRRLPRRSARGAAAARELFTVLSTVS